MLAKGPHQIQTTIKRIQFILNCYKNEKKLDSIKNLEICIDYLQLSSKRLEQSGSGEIDDILPISTSVRETSMKETTRIAKLTDIGEKMNQNVLRRTFNMRGMIYSPRPNFIPGGTLIPFFFYFYEDSTSFESM